MNPDPPAGGAPPTTESVRARFARPLDLVVVAALLLAGAKLTMDLLGAPRGARAVVSVDGRPVAWYPLGGRPVVDSFQGELGTLRLRHGDGEIRLIHAPCPGRLCVRQGAAHRLGEKLVCVPSRVVVSIEGDEEDPEALDAVH